MVLMLNEIDTIKMKLESVERHCVVERRCVV